MFLSSNCHWVSIWLVLSKTSSIISLAVNNWLSNNFSFPSTNLKVTDGASAVFNNVCEITSYEYNKLRQGLTLGWCDERIKATYLWICLFEPLCLNLSKYFSCGSRSTIKCWWTRITIEQVSMRSTAHEKLTVEFNMNRFHILEQVWRYFLCELDWHGCFYSPRVMHFASAPCSKIARRGERREKQKRTANRPPLDFYMHCTGIFESQYPQIHHHSRSRLLLYTGSNLISTYVHSQYSK